MDIIKKGQIPGKGTYVCMDCNYKVIIQDDETRLYSCPKCGAIYYKKIADA